MELRVKEIPGYEGRYSIDESGVVKVLTGFHKGRVLSQRENANGYLRVELSKNGEKKFHAVHRILAKLFILNPNPEKYDQINHKNGIKTDNRLENLEWCNNSENQLHAYRTGLRLPPRNSGRSGEDHWGSN
jgi:hypothetical protein